MTEAPTTADRPNPPDPAPDRSANHAPPPDHIARLLCLLHMVIGYGQSLASTLRQHTPGTDIRWLAIRFHTRDVATMLARVRRGLMLAAALQAWLLQRAGTGRDVKPVRPHRTMQGPRKSGTRACSIASRRRNLIDLPLDRMPTAAEIAEELRRRPIGAIIVDICRDLGILPGDLPPAWRRELSDIVLKYGGSLSVLVFQEWTNELRPLVAAALQQAARSRTVRPPAQPAAKSRPAPPAAEPRPAPRAAELPRAPRIPELACCTGPP